MLSLIFLNRSGGSHSLALQRFVLSTKASRAGPDLECTNLTVRTKADKISIDVVVSYRSLDGLQLSGR